MEEVIELYDRPAIFNTDQKSKFTSFDFTAVLKKNEVKNFDERERNVDG
jgi:hypothetical protein